MTTITHDLLASTGGDLVLGLLLFTAAGIAMSLGALLVGKLTRTSLPHPEKGVPYECGEPAIGSSWVQFDLRFYVVALVFIIFDIEIALFYPWAVVYGGGAIRDAAGNVDPAQLAQVQAASLWDMVFFFGVIVVGFLYLWKFGYLDWVRATTTTSKPAMTTSSRAAEALSRAARQWT